MESSTNANIHEVQSDIYDTFLLCKLIILFSFPSPTRYIAQDINNSHSLSMFLYAGYESKKEKLSYSKLFLMINNIKRYNTFQSFSICVRKWVRKSFASLVIRQRNYTNWRVQNISPTRRSVSIVISLGFFSSIFK